MSDDRQEIFDAINAERIRQDAKWGQQNHRDVDPVLTDRKGWLRTDGVAGRWPDGCDPQRMAEEYEIPTAARARQRCQSRGGESAPDSWGHILIEEVAELIEAATLAQTGSGPEADVDKELVQVTAVCVAWIEARRRRAGQ